MINKNFYSKYNKNNPYIPESMIRMYDLDFSNLKQLILDEEVLVIGYRYKEFCDDNVEYIMLDKNSEHFYIIEQKFLGEELERIFFDLSYISELFVSQEETSYEVYWLTNVSLKFILPSIKLLENKEMDINNKSYCKEYVSIFGEKIKEILDNNLIKESNNVKFYSLDDLEEVQNHNDFKLTHSEKLKITGTQLLQNKPFMFFGGFCTGKILEMIFT